MSVGALPVADPATTGALPVAGPATTRHHVAWLLRRHRRVLLRALGLHSAAAVTGLAGPWLLGRLVDGVTGGTTLGQVDRVALLLAGFVLAQTLLTRAARLVSATLGEQLLAEEREQFVERVVGLPLTTVETAGTGDLLTRTTGDIDTLSRSARLALPEILVATVSTVLILAGALFTAPLLVLPCVVVLPPLLLGTRWYLERAPAGYLRERAAYSVVNASLAESAEGARTIEALRLQDVRVGRGDDDLREAYAAERYTLRLRTLWFPVVEISLWVAPLVVVLLTGGWLHARGLVSVGEVTTVALYMQQLIDPADRLLSWLDELQVGATSLARLLGVGTVQADREVSGVEPTGIALAVVGARYAYLPGREVLRGVDLDVRPGERLAVVGPSGAGKSTLGRLLAGIHPPGDGRVTVGGVPLVDLPLDRLRREVALVTQEHHVFVGTLADNLRLARPAASADELAAALDAVDARHWADALPGGLDTLVGTGGERLTPAQAQQVALARLVLADPHTLILDEATALLDPRAARHLERSLAAVLAGRTVVAIAHRLHTARDADRVAVMADGRITELGSHEALLAAGGSYAALWQSWRGQQREDGQDLCRGPERRPEVVAHPT